MRLFLPWGDGPNGTPPVRSLALLAGSPRPHASLAREHGPRYDDGSAAGDPTGSVPSAGPGVGPVGACSDRTPGGEPGDGAARDVEAVAAAVEVAVGSLDPTACGDEELRGLVRSVQTAIDRLTGLRARCLGALESAAIVAAAPGREQQALRQVRDRTADELRLTPSETKRAGETGRRLADSPAATAALTAGTLPAEHARVLADTLRWLRGEVRAAAEAELLAAAATEDARQFGRTCRRLLARIDADAACEAEDRRHARRSCRITQTPDGMTAVSAQGSGLDGEVLHTAIHAFTRPDASDEHRTTEQRSFDALVAVCRTALDVGIAPANRNVRPHLLVTVDEPTLAGRASGTGVAEAAWTGPLPWPQARQLLADAGVSRVLLDPVGLPTRAGEAVRTVPAGLWKALQVRHATCAGDGCSVPAAWCQVMHLDVPYRHDGRLDLESAAPGCGFHHRMYDRHGWRCTWIDGRPVIHHADRPPRDPGSGADPTTRSRAGPSG